MDVLIFDDDPYTAELLSEVLRETGYAVEKFVGGHEALTAVQKLRPRLVILDIMMPGLDGLSLCKAIATDPRNAGVKVVIFSGRSFKRDQEEAKLCGASAFLPKPLDIMKMKKTLLELLGAPSGIPAPVAPRPAVMTARVWGSRGPVEQGTPTHPTSCVSLEIGDRVMLLDAGTGLGALCAQRPPRAKEIWLLLSHYHPDHVEGLPALKKVLVQDALLKICGPHDPQNSLQKVVQTGLAPDPTSPFKIQLFGLSETRFNPWPDVVVATLYTRHPGNTLAYRIQFGGKSLVYCPDNEIETGDKVRTDYSEKLARFVRSADLLIHDARYRDEDYASQSGEGHGSPGGVLEVAIREGVRALALFHLDARYSDDDLKAVLAQVRSKAEDRFASLSVALALPGSALEVS